LFAVAVANADIFYFLIRFKRQGLAFENYLSGIEKAASVGCS